MNIFAVQGGGRDGARNPYGAGAHKRGVRAVTGFQENWRDRGLVEPEHKIYERRQEKLKKVAAKPVPVKRHRGQPLSTAILAGGLPRQEQLRLVKLREVLVDRVECLEAQLDELQRTRVEMRPLTGNQRKMILSAMASKWNVPAESLPLLVMISARLLGVECNSILHYSSGCHTRGWGCVCDPTDG